MGSTIDSSSPSIRDCATVGTPPTSSSFYFVESGGCSIKETEEFCPAFDYVSDEHGAFLVIPAAPEHTAGLPALVPEASNPNPLPGSSRLDKLYEKFFRRLDAALEARKAQQFIVCPHEVLEGNDAAHIHVPSSVTQGYVPVLDVVDVKAESGVVFGSVLVELKAGSWK